MCVRYQLRLFSFARKKPVKIPPNARDREMFPGSPGGLIRRVRSETRFEEAVWGLMPHWTRDPDFGRKNAYNARSETLRERPTFRGAVKTRRCLIPATAFFERAGGRWLRFSALDEQNPSLAFAGLYEEPGPLCPALTYAMVTTEPAGLVAEVHDRMPVLLSEEDFDAWLDPDASVEEAMGLLLPGGAERLRMEDAGPIGVRKKLADQGALDLG